MAAKGNAFALLEGDDDGESLLALVSTAAVKSELLPSAVDKRTGKNKKPRASSLSSFQSSSAPQRSSDNEKGREKLHGSERNNRNGDERQNRNSLNRNGFEPNNGQENGSRQNNRGGRFNRDGFERQNRNGFEPTNGQENGFRQSIRGGIVVKRNNGYRHDERPAADGLKRREGNSNGYQKKEKITNGHQKKEEPPTDDGWQVVVRSNSHKQSNANHLEAPRKDNVNGRERNFGRRREFNNGNGREAKVLEDKQHLEESGENGVSDGFVEKLSDNAGKDEKEYRNRNGGFGGNGRANRGGYGRGEGKFNGERVSNRGRYQEFVVENAVEGKSDEKEVQKDSGEQNAGPEGDETASKESDSSKGKHDKVVSKEETERMQRKAELEAERELEAKQMTLKQYEKQLEEKRKGLESLKTEERRVALDKEFESMQIIEKKNEETNFVKLNSATDKLKKKGANNKDDCNAHKVKHIIVLPRRPRTNNLGGRGGRDDDRNAATSGRPEVAGNGPHALMSVKLSFEDAKQFPALALDGSTKAK